MRNEPIQPRVDLRIGRKLKSAIMPQDVARAKQPFVSSSTSIEGGESKKEYKAELNMAPPSRPSNSTPRPRATNPIRVLGSPRRSRARRAREILRAGNLSGWLLRLQEAIERGDERASDVIALQAHVRTDRP